MTPRFLCTIQQVRAEEEGDLSIVGATAFAGGLADGTMHVTFILLQIILSSLNIPTNKENPSAIISYMTLHVF